MIDKLVEIAVKRVKITLNDLLGPAGVLTCGAASSWRSPGSPCPKDPCPAEQVAGAHLAERVGAFAMEHLTRRSGVEGW